ncbi:MAG: hypothetical protein ACYC2R_08850 [Burkholderiales bacterium]
MSGSVFKRILTISLWMAVMLGSLTPAWALLPQTRYYEILYFQTMSRSPTPEEACAKMCSSPGYGFNTGCSVEFFAPVDSVPIEPASKVTIGHCRFMHDPGIGGIRGRDVHTIADFIDTGFSCPTNSSPVNGGQCQCNASFQEVGGQCVLGQLSLSLHNLGGEVEPSGTTAGDGHSTRAAFVQVTNTQTGSPEFGVPVKITVEVEANSGGHNHHDAKRPKGTLSGPACGPAAQPHSCVMATTDGDGKAYFTFTAPQPSGTHTFTATCTSQGCSSQATGKIDVKVAGLVAIPASSFYTLTETDGTVIGATNRHTDNHYLTKEAANNLWRMAVSYQVEQPFRLQSAAPPLLHLNDASLVWGGKFDIAGHWTSGSHAEHRRGTVIDIRANSNAGAIAAGNFKKFIALAAFYGTHAKIHNPGEISQHFHVRLLGRSE